MKQSWIINKHEVVEIESWVNFYQEMTTMIKRRLVFVYEKEEGI